jgi:N6-L-threonylcarbamoyladenine synthase
VLISSGAAVLTGTGEILSEALASQGDVHEKWGGVVPKLAQEAHQQAIDGTIDEALAKAGMGSSAQALTAIAVTVGPGLGPCLQVGVKKAYELAARHRCVR